jgi:hypothetical protein
LSWLVGWQLIVKTILARSARSGWSEQRVEMVHGKFNIGLFVHKALGRNGARHEEDRFFHEQITMGRSTLIELLHHIKPINRQFGSP